MNEEIIVNNVNDIENQIRNKINEINKKNSKYSDIDVDIINQEIVEINKKLNNENIPLLQNKKNHPVLGLFEKIGILDPEGKNINPLTGESYQNLYEESAGLKYSDYGKIYSSLPTYESRNEIIQKMEDNQALLITAGTGSGKTVLVPKFMLHVLRYSGKIAVTIPRVSATKSSASFSAALSDVFLGDQIGYMVKGDKKASKATNLIYATDGYILAKMRGNDPLLSEFDALIIDEAHERNVNIDLILFLVKNILKNRPNFKFIVMSATIDPKIFLDYYKEFKMKHIELAGKPNFPVNEIFLKQRVNKVAPNGEIIGNEYLEKAVDVIMNEILVPNKKGDILSIFPTKADCDKACQLLQQKISKKKIDQKPFCISLTSISKERIFKNATEENYAIGKNKSYKNLEEEFDRRIVMATEVAESSLTFSGDPIDFVIDTGLSVQNKYYPETEIEALEKKYISKASHKQRKGRTGRLREGTCYNVFTEEEFKKFLDYPIPPIMQSDLTENILSFMTLSVISHVDLPFEYPKNKITKAKRTFRRNTSSDSIELGDNLSLNEFLDKMIAIPDISYIKNAIRKLFMIGSINIENNKGKITDLGKSVSDFREVDPFKATVIIESFNYKCSDEILNLISLLNILDDTFDKILVSFRPKSKDKNSKEYKDEMKKYDKKIDSLTTSYGDHITLHKIIKKYKDKKYNITRERGREILIPKENDDASKWAKEHFVSASKLKRALRNSKDLGRELGKVITRFRNNNPDHDRSFIFRNEKPILHAKLEDNIMQSLLRGYVGNVAKKKKPTRGERGISYRTCFPEKKEISQVDRMSLFNKIKTKPQNVIYGKLFSIFGRRKLQTVTKLPTKVISNYAKSENIKKCK